VVTCGVDLWHSGSTRRFWTMMRKLPLQGCLFCLHTPATAVTVCQTFQLARTYERLTLWSSIKKKMRQSVLHAVYSVADTRR